MIEIWSTTLWLSNVEADHLRNFNSLSLPKFGKYKKKNQNSSKSFSFYSGVMDVPRTTHLV